MLTEMSTQYKIPGDHNNGSIIFAGQFNKLGISLNTSNTTGLIQAEQIVSLKHASFTNVNAQTQDGSVLICPLTNVWNVVPDQGAEWSVEFPQEMQGINPTKARLYIPTTENSVKLFRIYSFPANGIMNLSYIDPETNELAFCDAWCPLTSFTNLNEIATSQQPTSNNDTFADNGSFFKYMDDSLTNTLGYGTNFQEFAFVNSVPMDKLTITVLDWYGSQGSLAGFQLYSDSIIVYGNDLLNEANCDGARVSSSSITSGTFESVQDLTAGISYDYLISQDRNATIVFTPNITYSGNYSIDIYTPGCVQDNSCSIRGIVNAVVHDGKEVVSNELIFQNNENNKYDHLYTGHFDKDDDVTIEVSFGSFIAEDQGQAPWMVVDKITVDLLGLDPITKEFPLNGIFEYSIGNFTDLNVNVSKAVGNSSINSFGASLNKNVLIDQVKVFDNSLFVLGNNNLTQLKIDSYDTSANETVISSIDTIPFNNSITNMFDTDTGLIFVGNFSLSGDLNNLSNNKSASSGYNVAKYEGNQLNTFGNNKFDSTLSTFANVTISGTEYYVFSDGNNQFWNWDNTNSTWVSPKFNLTQSAKLSTDQQLLVGSNFNIMNFTSSNQAYASSAFGRFNFTTDKSSSITNSFYVNSTLSVIGGTFTAGNTTNIGLVNNSYPNTPLQSLAGPEPSWGDSQIQSLYVDNNHDYLFIGVNGPVQLESNNITGMLVYSLQNGTFASVQPATLSTSSTKRDDDNIQVNAMVMYDKARKLLVGGKFDQAGSLNCVALCVYDIDNTRWVNPTSDQSSPNVVGEITDMKFFKSDQVLISGKDLKLGDANVDFLIYNFDTGVFSTKDSLNSGRPVEKFIITDTSNADLNGRMITVGKDFVAGFDGSKWNTIDSDIDYSQSAKFTDVKLLTVEKSTDYNQTYFNNNQILILAGTFSLKQYGPVNAAFFNGTSWIPYIFTSTQTNKLGNIQSLLIQDSYRFQSSQDLTPKLLSRGKVVGISFAAAVGSTVVLALLYIIPYFVLFKKKESHGQFERAEGMRIHEKDMLDAVNPEDLLHEIDVQRRI
ncbi:uncharacterized protein SPAPADRAFT_55941 [Spathaspora passalidarum NRRL Y-27907]|uniref:Bud site selection protein RAX2 n=1 Tax=Spathaspora passalidarum (strain NRRL Y-27907 / 11-Y1) TaxID=619300 RepID=G3ANC2_SPAPN|nr:uncharacterized protein SPAPADRAFT_55941 [Spathaspora passalidarum NRRL Y-27907]EGW32505.1 hypothetical protein SPAPADRAFT_55941 [Spathaspora passalidarum NRRL Y-27907]